MRFWWMGILAAAGCGGGEGDVPALVLNEFMAANVSTLTDDTGAFADWIELYNPGQDATSLEGMFLSDDLGLPERAPLDASLEVEAGGYLILFADAGVGTAPNHLPFALETNGEVLLLSYTTAEGAVEALDTVSYGLQAADVSYARSEDGAGEWAASDAPTPGEAN